jgi:hypothetical protein
MAQVVLGLGTSHSPQLSTAPELWSVSVIVPSHSALRRYMNMPCYRSPAGTGCAMGFAPWA